MDLGFVTPLGSLFALMALVPLAVHVLRRRRLSQIARRLGLGPGSVWESAPIVAALVAVPALLGVAAAQPVVTTSRTVQERTDAEAFVVLDVTRSMLAGAEPGAPTRFERARRVAQELRNVAPDVPFGVGSVTDRTLPHLFPTTDARVFTATLQEAIGVEQPPPSIVSVTLATNLNQLGAVPERNFFSASARKRVLVVLTDGETEPLGVGLGKAFGRRPRIETVFVRFGTPDERIYETGIAEGGYEPRTGSSAALARAMSLVGGQLYTEGEVAEAAAAVRSAVGEGPTVSRQQESGRLALMPWVTLAVLVPLAVVLLSRNVWWAGRPRVRDRLPTRVPEAAKVSEPRGVAQPG